MARLVVLESPYAAPTPERREVHERYRDACMRDSIAKGEGPLASTRLYCGPLNDDVPEERALGIALGLEWGRHALASVFYVDLGVSPGMILGAKEAGALGRPVEIRTLSQAQLVNAIGRGAAAAACDREATGDEAQILVAWQRGRHPHAPPAPAPAPRPIVHVVIGRLGEYSDAREWTVRAFLDAEAAKAFAAKATEHAARLVADEDFRERVYYSGAATDTDLDELARFDPTLVYTIENGPCAGQRRPGSWMYASEGPTYGVATCPMGTP